MRTLIRETKDDLEDLPCGSMDKEADAARASSDTGRSMPKVPDMRTLNVLADTGQSYKSLGIYNSHMSHAHEVSLTDILEEFEMIMATAASKSGYSRSGDKALLDEHRRKAEDLCDMLKKYLDKLIAAERSVLVVNQTNYSVILENEKLRERMASIQKLHEEQLKRNQHTSSQDVVEEIKGAIEKMEELKIAAITAIESQTYNSDVESLSVNHDSYKQKWESEKLLTNSLSQRLSSANFATAIVTERLNSANLRMATLPLAQLDGLLSLDVSDPSTLLRESLHEQRDYTTELKFSKGQFAKWSVSEKDKLNMQSYTKIVSPGLRISPAEQSEAEALEEVWKITKGRVYKPNPPLQMVGIEIAKKAVVPKKTGFTGGGAGTTTRTYAGAAGRGGARGNPPRQPSPVKKRARTEVLVFTGQATFWLHSTPPKEEFMDTSHSAWNTPMNEWAYPSTELSIPHPWNSSKGREQFGDAKCDLWKQAYTVMCEAHSLPENVINEHYDRQQRTSVFDWLHQPTNRQRPPQTVQQLLSAGLFPQTLRLLDPLDAFTPAIRDFIVNTNSHTYLRVVVKPGKRYHGTDFQRKQGDNIRLPGFNDRTQYKPSGVWQGYTGQQYPSFPEACDLFERSRMSKTVLRRSTLAVSNAPFLHTIKNELKNGEGREIMYRLYSLLPACMVDIKGHLRDLKLEQQSDHFMSSWADSQLLTHSIVTDEEDKTHRVTHLDIPKFIVLTFGEQYSGITPRMCNDGSLAVGTLCNWSFAPESYPLDALYCDVEEWLYNAERCIMETSLRIHCAWSELHHIVYERHRHRLRTLYSAISKSFYMLVEKDCDRPVFQDRQEPALWHKCHTGPQLTEWNQRPCSFDKEQHFKMSRWTCRKNGRFTRPPYANYEPTTMTASQQNKGAGQR